MPILRGMEPMSVESFSCVKHPMTLGEHICGECGHQFCTECVVFPFGTAKPPLCIPCALEKGGVRRQPTGRPKLTRRSIKERLSNRQQAEPAPAPATPAPTRSDQEPWLDDELDPDRVPGAWRQRY